MSEEKKFCASTFHTYSPEDLSKTWFVYYYVEGKRIRKYGDINKYKTRQARLNAAERLIRELQERLVGEGQTIKERIYLWLEDQEASWKKRTHETYKSKIDLLFEHVGEYMDQKKLDEFMTWVRKNRHATTYNTYVVMIRKAFKDIGEEKLVEQIQPIKTIKTPARYFLATHIKLIKEYLQEHDLQLWLFVQFIFYCFIRPGELRLLTFGDLLIDERKIFIRSTVSKNGKSQYVAIPQAFLPQLEHLKGKSSTELIFPGKNGRPLGRNTMCSRHRKMLQDLGFSEEFKLYSWKHTGAVMAVKAGIGVKELQMQLRHHSLDQVNEYLRQMGVWDMDKLRNNFPEI